MKRKGRMKGPKLLRYAHGGHVDAYEAHLRGESTPAPSTKRVTGTKVDRSKEDPPPKRPPPAIGHRG